MPVKEKTSPWDCDYVTKEMYLEALGLKQVENREELADDILPEDVNSEETLTVEETYNVNEDVQTEELLVYEDDADNNQNIENKNMTVPCPKCQKVFKDKRSLKCHVYDTHSGTKCCPLCPKSFEKRSVFKRHMKQVHGKGREEAICMNCGKMFSRLEYLKKHETKCLGESTNDCKLPCQYCDKILNSKDAKRYHEKKKHRREINGGYILVDNQVTIEEPEEEEYICKVCIVPQKFSTKNILHRHMKRKHNGRHDVIKSNTFTRYLSDVEVKSQQSKRVGCEMCTETFNCQQNLQEHMTTVHGVESSFKCTKCPTMFNNKRSLTVHLNTVHITPSFECPECGKKSKLHHHHKKHMKIHGQENTCQKTPISSLKRSQQYKRSKKEIDKIKRQIFEAPEQVKRSMWNSIMKDCPYYYDKIKDNPLTEAEVIELINDNNLVDVQVLNICKFMRQKWGQGVITPNIRKQLIKRKSLLDPFFTLVTLDSSTKLHFKTKKGKILSRSVVYCHDIPGLIAFKKLIENVDETKEMLNVVGVDDGKQILKVVWNWSLMFENDRGKKKLMGPKKSIVLFGVSKVKETHHNMKVMMELTKMNEIEYAMSMDLKLINISIGICSHSSR